MREIIGIKFSGNKFAGAQENGQNRSLIEILELLKFTLYLGLSI